MALDPTTLDALQAWVNQMASSGRVATRYPSGILEGQLASRLDVPDPTLGAEPAEWDYQLAPFTLRVADNWQSTTDEFRQALMAYSQDVLGFTTDLAGAAGAVVHQTFSFVGDAAGAAFGVPPWMVWGALGLGGYYVLTHVLETKRYVKSWVL